MYLRFGKYFALFSVLLALNLTACVPKYKYSHEQEMKSSVVEAEDGGIEPVSLLGYKKSQSGFVELATNSVLYEDSILRVHCVEKRLTKAIISFQIYGNCFGKDLKIEAVFDDANSTKSCVTLDHVVGGMTYNLLLDIPEDFDKVMISGIEVKPTTGVLSEVYRFGEQGISLDGVSTLKYACDSDVLIFNKTGVVIEYLHLSGEGTTPIEFGAEYFRFVSWEEDT